VQDARALAVMSVLGGFLAPLLAASDDGNYIALFSYYLILNLGICAIVWFKAWRELTLLGFAFTFVIASLWGYYSYQFNFYLPTQLFLIAFFLLYAAIPVVEAKQHSSSFKKIN
jgi:uncharacterized membrane protein